MTIQPSLARLVIGVTGHRDPLPEHEHALRRDVRAFFWRLQVDFPDLGLQVVSALAAGADQLVAEEALALDIPVLAPLPMPQGDYERDFEEPAALERFRALVARCDVLSLPVAGEDATSRAGSQRDRQYVQVGEFIASHCQILLALWNGEPSDSPGGTADVVRFHCGDRGSVVDGTGTAANMLAEGPDYLIYHLHCPRRVEHPPRPDPGARWLTADGARPGDGPIPDKHRRAFAHMEAHNQDLERHATAMKAAMPTLLPDDAGKRRRTRLTDRLESLYRQSDWLAMHFQRQVRRNLLATHALAVGMGFTFILYDSLFRVPWLLVAFLACFGAGWIWNRVARHRDWHRKYLDYRALAEGLRVQLYWHLAGVEERDSMRFSHDTFLQKQDLELEWIRHVMRGAVLVGDRRQAPGREWLYWTINDWVGDSEGATGQLGYYRRKGAQCERHYRLTERLGTIALAAGLLVAVFLLAVHGFMPRLAASYLLVLVGLLPLIAGVREAYSEKKADKELIKQYRFMAGIFARARKALDAAVDDGARRDVLRALGQAALQEHSEWIVMQRERPLGRSRLA